MTGSLPTAAVLLGLLAVVPTLLQQRDTAMLLANRKPPAPPYGTIRTISLEHDAMARVAAMKDGGQGQFSHSFDMYYEAQLDGCDPTAGKNFVMISGTNGASWQYWDIISHFRKRGYCTLNFDHRSHGRSEDAPGELTAELLAEDAAAIIRHVFGKQPVHVLGWSLGGAVGYYLGIEHPDIITSLTVSGMASCFGRTISGGSCDMSFDWLKWFFSRDLILRLLGTQLQGVAAVTAIKMHDNDANMRYFRQLSTGTMTRTPVTWGRWNKTYYHEEIQRITAPVLLLAGGHEHLIGFDKATLEEDARRIPRAEPPQIFEGFSHFLWLEEVEGVSGLELGVRAMDAFHAKIAA